MRCIKNENIRDLIRLVDNPIMDFSFLWNNPSNHLSVILTKEDDIEIEIGCVDNLYDYYRYYDDKTSNPITITFGDKEIYDKIISKSPTIKKIQIMVIDENNIILSTKTIDKVFYFQFGEDDDIDDKNNQSYSVTFGRNVGNGTD